MKKNLAIITVLGVITATQAFADRGLGRRIVDRVLDSAVSRYAPASTKLVIKMGNEHYKGFNVIKLKQELKYQNPGINLKNLELEEVKLVAKTKKGRGQATLVVGQNASYPLTVGGTPRMFHNDARGTFDKVVMANPSYNSQGKWQIELDGNFKVKRVVVFVKKKRGRHRGAVVNIPMYDQHSRGFDVLKLKQLIKQQNPNMQMQKMKLQSVTLVAKSKKGRGSATLVVGQDAGYAQTIDGSPRAFHSSAPRTYSHVVLHNPGYGSQGKWQVELQGNIKVKSVIVKMKRVGGAVSPGPIRRNPRRGGGRLGGL